MLVRGPNKPPTAPKTVSTPVAKKTETNKLSSTNTTSSPNNTTAPSTTTNTTTPSNGQLQSRARDYSGDLMARHLGANLGRPQLPPDDLAAINAAQGTSSTQDIQETPPNTAVNPAGDRQQAYTNTCGVNTIMAMEAAVNPESAAQYSGLSDQERSSMEFAMMRAAGFQANQVYTRGEFAEISHGTQAPAGQAGRGLNVWGMKGEILDRFGSANISTNKPPTELVDEMVGALQDGSPIAMGLPGHWVAATDVRGEPGQEEILVNDSWTGESHWVGRDTLADGSWTQSFGGDNFLQTQGNLVSIVYPDAPPQLNPDSASRNRQENFYGQL